MDKSKIYGLILSAGLSGRMKKFKPLADFKGKSFINSIINKLDKVCSEIIIVTGFRSDDLRSAIIKNLQDMDRSEIISKLKFTFNEVYRDGMFTSLKKGISNADVCDWILYHFVDQPGLPDKFYPDFVRQVDSSYDWIQPVYNKLKGHPVLLGKNLLKLISEAPDDANLRDISRDSVVKKKFWDCDYKEIFQDIDTDEDYERLE